MLTIETTMGTFRLRDPKVVKSAMFGNCLAGEYERYPDVWMEGTFRCDQILSSQIEFQLGKVA